MVSITVTAGAIITNVGSITATAGAIIINEGSITVTAGGIIINVGGVNATVGSITAIAGGIIINVGGITATTGSITAIAGTIITIGGGIILNANKSNRAVLFLLLFAFKIFFFRDVQFFSRRSTFCLGYGFAFLNEIPFTWANCGDVAP